MVLWAVISVLVVAGVLVAFVASVFRAGPAPARRPARGRHVASRRPPAP